MSETESLIFPLKTCPAAFLPYIKGNSSLGLVHNLNCSRPSPSHSQYIMKLPLAQPSVYTPNPSTRHFYSYHAGQTEHCHFRTFPLDSLLTSLPLFFLHYSLFSTQQPSEPTKTYARSRHRSPCHSEEQPKYLQWPSHPISSVLFSLCSARM